MRKIIERIFERFRDPVVSEFTGTGIFHHAPFSKAIQYKMKFSGFRLIAVMTSAVEGGLNGLYMNLRVYRSPGRRYMYLLVWSYGDDSTEDKLLGAIHHSKKGFFEDDMGECLYAIISSTRAMKAMHEVYLKAKKVSFNEAVVVQKEKTE